MMCMYGVVCVMCVFVCVLWCECVGAEEDGGLCVKGHVVLCVGGRGGGACVYVKGHVYVLGVEEEGGMCV